MMEFNRRLRFHFAHLPNGCPGILDRALDGVQPLPEIVGDGPAAPELLAFHVW